MKDLSLARARCSRLDHPTQPAGWHWKAETGSWATTQRSPALTLVKPQHNSAHLTSVPFAPVGSTSSVLPASPGATPRPPDAKTSSAAHTLHMAAVRLAHILAEALAGKRRFGQLTMWFDPASLGVLADRHSRWKGGDIQLASVRVQATSDHCAEVALRLTTSGVSHAVALTVRHSDGQWRGRDVAIG